MKSKMPGCDEIAFAHSAVADLSLTGIRQLCFVLIPTNCFSPDETEPV
jgi:hypothetical protein